MGKVGLVNGWGYATFVLLSGSPSLEAQTGSTKGVINKVNLYDVEAHAPEIHGREETQTHDVKLIMKLLRDANCSTKLEALCGTGRILLPLTEDGCEIAGLLNELWHPRTSTFVRNKIAELFRSPSDTTFVTEVNEGVAGSTVIK